MLQFLDTDILLIFGVIGLVLIALYLMKKPQSKGRSIKATIINRKCLSVPKNQISTNKYRKTCIVMFQLHSSRLCNICIFYIMVY